MADKTKTCDVTSSCGMDKCSSDSCSTSSCGAGSCSHSHSHEPHSHSHGSCSGSDSEPSSPVAKAVEDLLDKVSDATEDLVLVDFWAERCGPCKRLSPKLDEWVQEFTPRLKVIKVNVDEDKASPEYFEIESLPTVMFFRGGSRKGAEASEASEDSKEADASPKDTSPDDNEGEPLLAIVGCDEKKIYLAIKRELGLESTASTDPVPEIKDLSVESK